MDTQLSFTYPVLFLLNSEIHDAHATAVCFNAWRRKCSQLVTTSATSHTPIKSAKKARYPGFVRLEESPPERPKSPEIEGQRASVVDTVHHTSKGKQKVPRSLSPLPDLSMAKKGEVRVPRSISPAVPG